MFFVNCLDFHNIDYHRKYVKGHLDKRTGNINKDFFYICLKNSSVEQLMSLKTFKLKGEIIV